MVLQVGDGLVVRPFAAIALVVGGVALLLVSAIVTVTGVLLILGGLMTPMAPPDVMIRTVPIGLVVALIGVGIGAVGLVATFRGPRSISGSGSAPDLD
jgi:hypothetical protein